MRSRSGSAAAPLLVQQVALFHAVDPDVLAPLAAVLLTLGRVEPAAVTRVVARLALDELGERTRVLGYTGGRGQDARGERGEDEEEGRLHCGVRGGTVGKYEERLKRDLGDCNQGCGCLVVRRRRWWCDFESRWRWGLRGLYRLESLWTISTERLPPTFFFNLWCVKCCKNSRSLWHGEGQSRVSSKFLIVEILACLDPGMSTN